MGLYVELPESGMLRANAQRELWQCDVESQRPTQLSFLGQALEKAEKAKNATTSCWTFYVNAILAEWLQRRIAEYAGLLLDVTTRP